MYIVTSKTIETRRRFLRALGAGGAFLSVKGLYAEALTLTPHMTEGPYYPLAKNIPLDKDNDLVRLGDNLTPASGTVTHISGRVLDKDARPVRGALVELWHCDASGEYIHSTDQPRNPRADANFAGFGQCLTGTDGGYRFRTIRAGLYPGRTRHYHWGITVPGQMTRFTSQTYWEGEPGNANDGVLRGVTDPAARASVVLDYGSVAGGAAGEVAATWDIAMGFTPVEPTYPGVPEGRLVIKAEPVPDPEGGGEVFKLPVPAYKGYSYEVYADPTKGDLGWAALPFSVGRGTRPDRNIHTATAEGSLEFYVRKPSVRGFYHVAFRVPGANTGTPNSGGRGPGGPGGGGGRPRGGGSRPAGDRRQPPPRPPVAGAGIAD